MKHINKFIQMSVVLIVVVLSGCTVLQSSAKINMRSVGYLNPDINGNASPVVVTIYQLKNSYAFQQADYESLVNNSGKALGADLLDKNSVEIRPGNDASIFQKIYPNTRYIGIVAAYRSPKSVGWHRVVKLKSPGASVIIDIDLEAQGFILKSVNRRALF